MFEKVNPSHPDKLADRIAGAIVDLAYAKSRNPKVACEVLIGHGDCHVILETSEEITYDEVSQIVERIAGFGFKLDLSVNKQDEHLAKNQSKTIKCGDNGIFKGTPITAEQRELSRIAHCIYAKYPTDGKYILDYTESSVGKLIICQSNAKSEELLNIFPDAFINPLGDWTGGTNVDTGATNRKLGSDMGDAVTGGGLAGKDLSKADVSVNVVTHCLAQEHNCVVIASCAIGDSSITFHFSNNEKPILYTYKEVVEEAREYISRLGGFEKFAEWGLCN